MISDRKECMKIRPTSNCIETNSYHYSDTGDISFSVTLNTPLEGETNNTTKNINQIHSKKYVFGMQLIAKFDIHSKH